MEATKETYKLEDGQEYARVTTILGLLAKPQLIQWSANMAAEKAIQFVSHASDYDLSSQEEQKKIYDEIRLAHTKKSDEAKEHGTDMHAVIENYLKTKQKPELFLDTDIAVFEKFIEWEKENVKNWIEIEYFVRNDDLCYAGKLDAIAEMQDGEKAIIDFKTSSGIWDEYWMQLAAYSLAVGRMNMPNHNNGIIIRLGKDGAFDVKEKTITSRMENAFECLTNFYYLQKDRRLKNKKTLALKEKKNYI